jgi:Tfp pilus assembly protein PilX
VLGVKEYDSRRNQAVDLESNQRAGSAHAEEAIRDREHKIFRAKLAKAEREAWERVRTCPKALCCIAALRAYFLGGNIQRGTKLVVNGSSAGQPRRRKRLYVTVAGNKGAFWFSPNAIHSYNLRTEPPPDDKITQLKNDVSKIVEDLYD